MNAAPVQEGANNRQPRVLQVEKHALSCIERHNLQVKSRMLQVGRVGATQYAGRETHAVERIPTSAIHMCSGLSDTQQVETRD